MCFPTLICTLSVCFKGRKHRVAALEFGWVILRVGRLVALLRPSREVMLPPCLRKEITEGKVIHNKIGPKISLTGISAECCRFTRATTKRDSISSGTWSEACLWSLCQDSFPGHRWFAESFSQSCCPMHLSPHPGPKQSGIPVI